MVLLISIGWAGVFFLVAAFNEYELNGEFLKSGITVPGRFEKYEWVVTSAKSGDKVSGERPVISYTTNDGSHYLYRADEYGVVRSYQREKLPETPIQVTYLKDNPSVARVQAWHSSKIFSLAIGGLLILGLLIYMVFIIVRGFLRGSIKLSI